MSNELAVFGSKLPAHLQNAELDETTKALAGNQSFGRRISIKGSVFRMIVDGKQVAENEDRAMNIVVVAAAPTINRQFYKDEFSEDKVVSPTCWSADGRTPSKDSEEVQSTSCDTCPQNVAGSGKGESRACRYQQRLAVVLENDLGGNVYQLALPATSIFGKGEPNNVKMPLQAYARYLAEQRSPITAVLTEMRFDTKSSTPKLTFKPIRHLTAEEYAISKEQGASQDAADAVTLTVFKVDNKNKPVATAAPAEDTPEPKVVKAAKPAPVAAKKTAAQVIGEWDD